MVEKNKRRAILRKSEEASETDAIEAKEWADEARTSAIMWSTISAGTRIVP
jgi:hypothetical protein